MLNAERVELVEQKPVEITNPAKGTVLIDFGKVAFGNLEITPPAGAKGDFKVHFGEKFKNGRIDRKPPGTVRYSVASGKWDGKKSMVIGPAADKKNTQQGNGFDPPAILTPKEWGVITPFRWVEIEGWPGKLDVRDITRRAAFSADWDENASHFESSDETLNRIWDLCKYSIKATTFAGVYVDGDRERIPYEADSYLNQLSHYYTDDDIIFARDTFDYLMKYATWPTEWASHMIFIAHADWMRTGDVEWLAPRYESLKGRLLLDRVGEDGLVKSNAAQIKKGDIVQQIQSVIIQNLPSGKVSDNLIAKELNLSERSLQRKLKEKGTTFRSELDNVREMAAIQYIKNPVNTMSDIAFLLGFSEQSAFSRAFKKWMGTSPMKYRNSIK